MQHHPVHTSFRIFEHLPHSTMVLVKGGDFEMGDEIGDLGKASRPQHPVNVKDFWMGAYPVTQALWKAVMGKDNNPSHFQDDQRPVERVSWEDICGDPEYDIIGFLEKLNAIPDIAERNRRDGMQFHLPSEAQWEYAARGGQEGLKFPYSYAGSNQLKEVGWYHLNSHRETKPVGLKVPNYLGLYDMSGNVEEWCADVWHDNYDDAPEDGSAWMRGGNQNVRVVRGGSWGWVDVLDCRVAYRVRYYSVFRGNFIGFRLARY